MGSSSSYARTVYRDPVENDTHHLSKTLLAPRSLQVAQETVPGQNKRLLSNANKIQSMSSN